MKGRPYQEEALDNLFDYFRYHTDPSQNPIIAMPTGCHAAGHGILMHDGSVRRVEEVAVGDRVMGPDSLPRTVLALARGRQEMRRVVPTKGEPFVVNLDHKLSVKKVCEDAGNRFACEQSRVETITVRQYEDGTKWYRHVRKLRRVGVSFPRAQQPLCPRFVGLMLSDGSLANGVVHFSGTEDVIINWVRGFAQQNGCGVRDAGNRSWVVSDPLSSRSRPNRIMAKFQELGLRGTRSSTIFIPRCYLVADRWQRLELLSGIVDGDGYKMEGGGYEVVTISEQFSRDLLFLCRSLGFAAYCSEGVAKLNGRVISPKWRVTISGEGLEQVTPLLEYKRMQPRRQKKDALCTGFTVEKLPEDNYYGFTLDGDNLYLDESFTVHHNSGKAFVIAEFCRRVLTAWPSQRILCLVHVKELVEQNAATMKRVWPQAPLGVFSAGLRQRVAHMPITFAGVMSVAANLDLFGWQDIVVVDEAHMIADGENTAYRKVLDRLRATNPNLRVIGLSATPFRMGLGMITDGGIFTHVCYDLCGLHPFNRLLHEGYLCPLIPMKTDVVMDVSKVAKRGGDFVGGALQEAVNREALTRAALTEAVPAARNRSHWLIFCAGVEHAEDVAKMLQEEFGISCGVVHGGMSSGDRDRALADFKAGRTRALTNANVLTTGFDFPALDCIICLRPTISVVLHVQILGRLTRPFYAPGYDLDTVDGRLAAIAASPKRNGLVLDFAGNVGRLGPINDPRIPKRKGEGTGDVPVKVCDHCGCQCHISARVCDNCLMPFVMKEKITERASTVEIIAATEPPEVHIFAVDNVTYDRHHRPNSGKPPSLKVSYFCGLNRYSEWVCLEHHGSPIKLKADKWWRERHGAPAPASIDEAIALHTASPLRRPKQIRVWTNRTTNGKLQPEVLGSIFEEG